LKGGRRSSLAVEEPNQRLGVAERVVHWLMIVLRSTETFPVLGASKSRQPARRGRCDSSPGMPNGFSAGIEMAIDYSYNRQYEGQCGRSQEYASQVD
jgi:hypothetical protein